MEPVSAQATSQEVSVAPTESGCCVRVIGRGTMRESPAVKDVALRTLGGDPTSVVVLDLRKCTYLDSTFLGCMVDLLRAAGRQKQPRLMVAGTTEKIDKLLSPCRINKLIPSRPDTPPVKGEWLPLQSHDDPTQRSRHIMECHRALAAVDSPMRDVFNKIADQLEQELKAAEQGDAAKA